MPLDEAGRKALLVEAHHLVEQQATRAAEALCGLRSPGELYYPPNGGLTERERSALPAEPHPEHVSLFRKVIADSIATAFFNFFAVVDAVGDPYEYPGVWLPLRFELAGDDSDETMLHAAFFDTYRNWRDLRPDPGWQLDNWAGSRHAST